LSPPTASLAQRDVLLATKLHIPRPRPGFVLRPRLLERLQQGMEQLVVLVCTPAGFGKTSLLADWARRGRRPVAWLSLDEGDNDPARFWPTGGAWMPTDGRCLSRAPSRRWSAAAGRWRFWPPRPGAFTVP